MRHIRSGARELEGLDSRPASFAQRPAAPRLPRRKPGLRVKAGPCSCIYIYIYRERERDRERERETERDVCI